MVCCEWPNYCLFEDSWVSKLPLAVSTRMFDAFSIEQGRKASYFITSDGRWDLAKLGIDFHPSLVEAISAIPIPHRMSINVLLRHGMSIQELCNSTIIRIFMSMTCH